MYRSKIITLTEWCVSTMFWLGIPACALSPAAVYLYGYRGFDFYVQAGAVFLSGIASVFIMRQLRKMFKTIKAGDPFVVDNVKSLGNVGIAAWCIGLVYVLKLFFLPTVSTVMIVIIFVCGGLFCFTLSRLFETAVRIKLENDLTI